jgi:hypothetical protein
VIISLPRPYSVHSTIFSFTKAVGPNAQILAISPIHKKDQTYNKKAKIENKEKTRRESWAKEVRDVVRKA